MPACAQEGRQEEARRFNVRHLAFVLCRWWFMENLLRDHFKRNEVPEVPLDGKHPFLEPGDLTASRFSAVSASF